MGIGRASAHQFAANSAKAVFICDYDDEFLAVHEREINSLYPKVNVHPRKFDAADEAAVKAVIDEAISKYGRLDIMFANAAARGTHTLLGDIEEEDFMRTMRINVLRRVAPHLHQTP